MFNCFKILRNQHGLNKCLKKLEIIFSRRFSFRSPLMTTSKLYLIPVITHQLRFFSKTSSMALSWAFINTRLFAGKLVIIIKIMVWILILQRMSQKEEISLFIEIKNPKKTLIIVVERNHFSVVNNQQFRSLRANF